MGAARRHIKPSEKFLAWRVNRLRQRPVGFVVRAVGIAAGRGGQRFGVRGKGCIEAQQDVEARVIVQAKIAVENLARQSGAGCLPMGRDQVMALCDQRIDAAVGRRTDKIGTPQIDQGIQHLTDTNAGHVISFSLRPNTRYPVASG